MLERFEDWWRAPREERQQALMPVLDRLEARDATIGAWVQVVPQWPTGDGPLSDIPFGVKDIIETEHLATEYGSPIYKGRLGTRDADIVAALRCRGGVLLGKTETCAFAWRTPARTVNPCNPAHTPGGSSAGSAAAVAAGMVPFTVGTQTHGSVIRPASFCGVTGFKPTWGLLPTEGVLPMARSLDTLGLFTHTAEGMALLWQAVGFAVPDDGSMVLGVPDAPLDVDAPMAEAFARTVAFLRIAGFTIQPLPITPVLATLPRENRIVEYYEGARVHEARYREFGDRLGDLVELVREGLRIPAPRYDAALAFIAECRAAIDEQFARAAVILTPAATGYAPEGLGYTGDSRMNSPWTSLGTPAVTIPMPVTPVEMPLGLQLTAAAGQDGRLLQTAVAVAAALYPARQKADA